MHPNKKEKCHHFPIDPLETPKETLQKRLMTLALKLEKIEKEAIKTRKLLFKVAAQLSVKG